MSYTGDVDITVVDGGAAIVSVPGQNVQAVIGTAGSGTVNTVVATRSLTTLKSTFASGPLLQYCGMALQSSLTNGGGVGPTVLAVRATAATAGFIRGSEVTVPGVSTTNTASPIQITTGSAHGLVTGDVVTIAGVVGQTGANGTFPIVVLSPTTFTLTGSTSVGAYVSGGTIAFAGTVQTGTGTSVMTFTGTPTDDYYPMVKIIVGGTIATTGIVLAVSYDRGQTFGPQIALGTATSLALLDTGGLDTGLTWHAAAGTLIAGDYVRCSTVAPAPNAAGIQAAIAALASYASISATGWGSMHILGVLAGSDATTIETTLDALATTNYLFTRAIITARDASPPTAWGGTGETAAAWSAAVLLDFSTVSARRFSVAAGYYNMPSAFPTLIANTPSYRRPLSWAYAAREAVIPTQRHAGRVADGALSQISVNPNVDPTDGFVYWDSATSPSLDYYLPGGSGRFTTARTRQTRQGYYISNPLSLAPIGSDFALFPQGSVMDVACTIAHSSLLDFVAADLQTAPNGTLLNKDRDTVYNTVYNAITANMQNVGMISGFTIAVDQTTNMQVTKTLRVTITIQGVAYILQVAVSLAFANQIAA